MPDDDLCRLVRSAARDWVWVPPDAQDLTTQEYRLTRYPWSTEVHWADPRRPVGELLEEVRERTAGDPRLRWWVRDGDDPAAERELRAAGFALVETVDVLALDLRPGAGAVVGRLAVPLDVDVRPADDEAGVRTVAQVSGQAFGEVQTSDAQVADSVEIAREGLRTGRWASRQYLALVDGIPAGAGGLTLRGDPRVALLWGGGVAPQTRGRGAYRGLLAARCAFAVDQGAVLALVKGRVETAAPVLRRAGFTGYGQERCYEVVPAGV